jgi:hypothetical protein
MLTGTVLRIKGPGNKDSDFEGYYIRVEKDSIVAMGDYKYLQ